MGLSDPIKILFVCSRNRRRSFTAEQVYRGFDRYHVRSRGTEREARIKLTEGDVGWADWIFTMEKRHTQRIRQKFREKLRGKQIVTLFIPDNFEPMEPALIARLRRQLQPHIEFPPRWDAEVGEDG